MLTPIAFSVPSLSPGAIGAIESSFARAELGSRGPATERVERNIQDRLGCGEVILTNSGSTALVVALAAWQLEKGDLVVVPSFCFVAVPQAVLLAGGTPYFVDVDPETGSLDPAALQNMPVEKIRGIIVVHYAGIAADMERILEIAEAFRWKVLEDSAHAFGGAHKIGTLGTLGSCAILSFDHQKNIQVGEAGAAIINEASDRTLARSFALLGTNLGEPGRNAAFDWVRVGIRASPPDYVAAVLEEEFRNYDEIQNARSRQWQFYDSSLRGWAEHWGLRLPVVPVFANRPTWHIFFVTFKNSNQASDFIAHMGGGGIDCRRHYSSLRTTAFGSKFRSTKTEVSDYLAGALVRLPLGRHLRGNALERIVEMAKSWRPELGT